MQLTHEQHRQHPNTKEIVLLCDHVSGPANQGALFRLADAFGVSEIIFCGGELDVTSPRLKKTARNTQSRVRFRESENSIQELEKFHQDKYKSIALDITSNSIDLQLVKNLYYSKCVLIIGSEQLGIQEELLAIAHHHLHIPMYGANSSMNVAQATAIALYELSNC